MASITAVFDKDGKKKWRARVRIKGYPCQSMVDKKKSVVTEWASSIEYKIRSNKFAPELESRKHTVSDMVDEYLRSVLILKKHQYKRKKSHLKPFKDIIGHTLLSDFSKSDVNQVIIDLSEGCTKKGTPRKQSTVARYLSTFNNCCEYAVNDLEWMPSNAVKKVKKPEESDPREVFLRKDELHHLVCVAAKKYPLLAEIIVVLVYTGMRVGECLNISISDVRLDQNIIVLSKTKAKKIRSAHIHGVALDLIVKRINRYKNRGKNHKIFGGNISKNYQKQRRALLKCLEICNIKDFGFHGLRHTTASYHAMSGAQLQDIAAILGHSSVKMSERYSHLMIGHVADKAKKLSKDLNQVIGEENER